jgi:hypothetical protein
VQLHEQDPIASLAGLLYRPFEHQPVGGTVALVEKQFMSQLLRQQTQRTKSPLSGTFGICRAFGLKVRESQLSIPDLKGIQTEQIN